MALPYFEELNDEHKKDGLHVVAVNDGDPHEWVDRYARENKLSFAVLMGGKGKGSLRELFGVKAYPTTYLLDSEGQVLWRYVGTNKRALNDKLSDIGFRVGS